MNKKVIEVFASGARTASPDPVIVPTEGAAGVYIVVEVTADPASASVVFNFDLYDPPSETDVTILDSAAVNSVSSNIYKISPALTASANLTSDEHVPPLLKISPVHADSDSITYSVGVHLL